MDMKEQVDVDIHNYSPVQRKIDWTRWVPKYTERKFLLSILLVLFILFNQY
jgi:hypothetical protein